MRINKPRNYKANKLKRGVTLIEMIIVVGIITVLLTILIGYSRETAKNLTLINNQAKLVSLFSRAKSLGQGFPVDPPVGYMVCGYGIKAEIDPGTNEYTGEFFLFRDLVSTIPFSNNCDDDADNDYTDPGILGIDERLEGSLNQFILETDYLEMMGVAELADPSDPILAAFDHVIFIPPDPTVIINCADELVNCPDPPVLRSNVGIKIKGSPSSFEIRVNNFGQITTK